MLGRATGAVLAGIDARLIEVEVDLGGGLPTISAVGLPDGTVREGIDRIRAALPHVGFSLPQGRIVVNLAPADVRKHGAGLDLPIAAALLAAGGQLAGFDAHRTVLVGELALDGGVRPVRGALSIALAARERGCRRLIVPTANFEEASLVDGLDVLGASSLADLGVAGCLRRPRARGTELHERLQAAPGSAGGPDLAEVRGQAASRRALEIAAAGAHHLLLVGPPGAGKTMLARRLPGILPPMSLTEAIEVTRVWSAVGLSRRLVVSRSFRAPHHGVSLAGLTGGGRTLRPGEASLASHGVLYLDELPEFRRDALEALRQPLEEGEIHVVRVHESAVFPARFMLVAAMNPCPCGFHGSPDGRCGCSPGQVHRYRSRLSGPLLDRFDLAVDVPPVDLASLERAGAGEPSAQVRDRVVAARRVQQERFGEEGASCNARMGPSDLDRFASLAPEARRILLQACARLGLSARAFDRVRRVARTIADLAGSAEVGQVHVVEAIQYRRRTGLSRD